MSYLRYDPQSTFINVCVDFDPENLVKNVETGHTRINWRASCGKNLFSQFSWLEFFLYKSNYVVHCVWNQVSVFFLSDYFSVFTCLQSFIGLVVIIWPWKLFFSFLHLSSFWLKLQRRRERRRQLMGVSRWGCYFCFKLFFWYRLLRSRGRIKTNLISLGNWIIKEIPIMIEAIERIIIELN